MKISETLAMAILFSECTPPLQRLSAERCEYCHGVGLRAEKREGRPVLPGFCFEGGCSIPSTPPTRLDRLVASHGVALSTDTEEGRLDYLAIGNEVLDLHEKILVRMSEEGLPVVSVDKFGDAL